MSMTCIEFRQLAGADPSTRDPGVMRHRLECRACADFLHDQQQLDRSLEAALRVPVPNRLPARIRWRAASQPSMWRRRVGAAATLLLSLGLGFGAWIASEQSVLADDVIAHVQHEPELLLQTNRRADVHKVNAVMGRSGFGLRAPLDGIAHAGLCPFRGRLVPHLVMTVDGEPVSVLLLRHVAVEDVETIRDDGFNGILVPTEYGSMAIVAGRAELIVPVRAQLEYAVSRGI